MKRFEIGPDTPKRDPAALTDLYGPGSFITFTMPEMCPECGRAIDGVGSGEAAVDPLLRRSSAVASPCGHTVEMRKA